MWVRLCVGGCGSVDTCVRTCDALHRAPVGGGDEAVALTVPFRKALVDGAVCKDGLELRKGERTSRVKVGEEGEAGGGEGLGKEEEAAGQDEAEAEEEGRHATRWGGDGE